MLQAELDEIVEAAGFVPERKKGRPRRSIQGRRPIRQGSAVFWAEKVLRHRNRPCYIDDLIRDIRELSGLTVQKPSLVSSLSRYVNSHDTFTRPKEGYYGLTAFEPEDAAAMA
jgi:hypothetical protein